MLEMKREVKRAIIRDKIRNFLEKRCKEDEKMDELFNPQSSSVQPSRILYTPSTFARSSLLHLQEVGSLRATDPHTSTRTDLVSFLCFVVLYLEKAV